jgi:hypothetical protein
MYYLNCLVLNCYLISDINRCERVPEPLCVKDHVNVSLKNNLIERSS